MKSINKSITAAVIVTGASLLGSTLRAADAPKPSADSRLAAEFMKPPRELQPSLYYWWMNGNVSKEGLTRDFEEMRKHGIGAAQITDGGTGGPDVPRGPAFMGDQWREMFRYALKEAARCGIKLSVSVCSGWNAGGPWVTPEHAAKKLISSEVIVQGPGKVTVEVPKPVNPIIGRDRRVWLTEREKKIIFNGRAEWNFQNAMNMGMLPDGKAKMEQWLAHYRDIAVLAVPVAEEPAPQSAPSPASSPTKTTAAAEKAAASQKTRLWQRERMVNLTGKVDADGKLTWEVPPGKWQVVRVASALGCWLTHCPGAGPVGLEIDPMSAEAMEMHFAETGAKMIADAGPLVGKTLQYFQMDSWEIEAQPTWTPKMVQEFQKRQGYDLLPYLPVLLGWTVDDEATTERFLRDYSQVVSDLMTENYYGRLDQLARQGGLLGTSLQSGGPFYCQWVDALKSTGASTSPQGEFWNPGGSSNIKQYASAAHIYGRSPVQAEALTTMGFCNFTDGPWRQKEPVDRAFCNGAQHMLINLWVSQADPETRPGWADNHICPDFNYKMTWWPFVDGGLSYITRCQYMLRRGVFAADLAYLRCDSVPDYPYMDPRLEGMKSVGYDYDWINSDALRRRGSAKDGRLVLSDGMNYRFLILPPTGYLSEGTIKQINALIEAGVSVVATSPREGLSSKALTGDWRRFGPGLPPDVKGAASWIHRRDGETDIYFVVCEPASKALTFRVTGKQPELWDPITGNIRDLPEFSTTKEGLTQVPLRLEAPQSFFVVFRKPTQKPGVQDPAAAGLKNFPAVTPVLELAGAWDVAFDPQWLYPETGTPRSNTRGWTNVSAVRDERVVTFDSLVDWTQRPEDAIRYYSGIAVYRKTFDLPEAPADGTPLFIDVGTVEKIAGVRLNGRDLGTVWCAPKRVAIPAGLLKQKNNELEIEVANLWPNRMIGDQNLPVEQRRTSSNLRTYETPYPKPGPLWQSWGCRVCEPRKKTGKPAELLRSGLLGPVRVMVAE